MSSNAQEEEVEVAEDAPPAETSTADQDASQQQQQQQQQDGDDAEVAESAEEAKGASDSKAEDTQDGQGEADATAEETIAESDNEHGGDNARDNDQQEQEQEKGEQNGAASKEEEDEPPEDARPEGAAQQDQEQEHEQQSDSAGDDNDKAMEEGAADAADDESTAKEQAADNVHIPTAPAADSDDTQGVEDTKKEAAENNGSGTQKGEAPEENGEGEGQADEGQQQQRGEEEEENSGEGDDHGSDDNAKETKGSEEEQESAASEGDTSAAVATEGGEHKATGDNNDGDDGDSVTVSAKPSAPASASSRRPTSMHLDADGGDLGPEKAELPAPPSRGSDGADDGDDGDDDAGVVAQRGSEEGEEVPKGTEDTEEGESQSSATEAAEPEPESSVNNLSAISEAPEEEEQDGERASASRDQQQEGHNDTTSDGASVSATEQTTTESAYTQAGDDGDAAVIGEPGEIQYSQRQQIVKVPADDGSDRLFNITVFTANVTKPFLGGFRHKKTGVEYHNASSQTPRKFRIPKTERFTRTTQTAIQRTHPKFATQTSVHTATQMTKEGVFVTSREDKIIVPTKYETAADKHARVVAAVIVIQKYYRRWQAKRVVGNLRYARHQYQQWQEEKERKRLEFEEMMRRREMDRRLNPRTPEDFDMLYASLQKWHGEQLEKVRLLPESEQPQARMDLLREETKYLNFIEQLKQLAATDNKEARVQKFLDDASTGRKWANKQYGMKVHVETPESKLAQELKEIYNLIRIPDLDVDERLDALLQLRTAVEKHDSRLTREILELIQREADLLGRRTRARNLEGLRKRLLNLFLQFIETPEYNPEAKRLMEVHQDKDFFKHNLVRCAGSQTYHTTSKFDVSPQKTTGLGKSKSVLAAENRALYREDNTAYRRILDACRRAEKHYADNSQCMSLLSVRDMRYLIDTVWSGKSALSEDATLSNLVLCRWNKHKELSPWNSILLTKDEQVEHLELDDPDASYGPNFVARIKQKHIRAKQHFTSLQSHLARAHKQQTSRTLPPKPQQLPSLSTQQQHQQQLPANATS
ncbi:hypothetical protein PTSG_07566 [Salpingoeca rosetta]|uniref:IQ motif and ubiquitin-like domain-containing protein n=1 Tax=Salpingoeca rosetta (strain ATCC 50818 / BSB-021) TaxID=946362 RepID=F2UH48_SALR5|nr:uncharacterized protein PTSG_07566 [Salpingoeca rosetta]EGD76447.1 hypothetical protein PTSG_07566 [Salpingoeca rosetta]|eukprot:XP_004991362.1 hypothetical protein PTSG_07566 [Salpingoeca rosetta]